MHRKLVVLFTGTLVLAAGLACGLAGQAPLESGPSVGFQQTQMAEANAPAAPATVPTAAALPTSPALELPSAPAAIPESRRLTLEYPPNIRVGDSDVIRLTLEVNTLGGLAPTAEVPGNTLLGKIVQIPNAYETHNVFAEARLDVAGLTIQPPDVQSEALLQGQPVTFYWSVQPTSAGTFRGTVWFYLRFVDKLSGAESRQTVSAQPVQIDAGDFLGFSGGFARLAGSIGSVIGVVMGFPFADDILKWLYGRIRRSG